MRKIHHAEMAQLIRREKELEKKLGELRADFTTWKDRVALARDTGRDELAAAAAERLDSIRDEANDLRRELKLIVAKKRLVRKEIRRPSGEEVRRAEALLESFRQSGLVDPDEANMEAEFDELRKNDLGEKSAPDDKEEQKAKPTPQSTSSKGTGDTPDLDDLDLAALENLDLDELERLVAAEDDSSTDDK